MLLVGLWVGMCFLDFEMRTLREVRVEFHLLVPGFLFSEVEAEVEFWDVMEM